jgi:hypothetical protein
MGRGAAGADDLTTMLRRIITLALGLLVLLPATAHARGGDYGFDGGTPRQQAQVRSALDASSFDWNLVPVRVTVHIGAYGTSYATPGHLWLEGRLLDAGTFAWATVQDEYAHQLDFFVLDDARREVLRQRLGATQWCTATAGVAHTGYGCERFASMVAWAYWPSQDNAYRPTSRKDESASMPASEFRALLAELIGARRALSSAPRAKATPSARTSRR